MRIGAIDIGTNTALFVIADIRGQSLHPFYDDHEIIRLGEGVDARRLIKPEAMKRCAEAVQRFIQKAKEFGCSTVLAAGTSAVRDAANQKDFLSYMLESTGLKIRILSGEEEALCTYLGGTLVLAENQHHAPSFVIDIGGGSTEMVIGKGEYILSKISMNIGSVRLTERFLKSDPVCPEEEEALRIYCRAMMQTTKSSFLSSDEIPVIGVAGTITTLAAMIQKMTDYKSDRINGFSITLHNVREQINQLRTRTIEERKQLAGLEAKRADVIFAGAVILEELMVMHHWPAVTATDYGLRHGLILQAIACS